VPIANIHILEGRTDEQKARLIQAVTDAIAQSLDARPEAIRVLVHDVPKTDWGIGGKTAKALGR